MIAGNRLLREFCVTQNARLFGIDVVLFGLTLNSHLGTLTFARGKPAFSFSEG
jgi:hypothetical protein